MEDQEDQEDQGVLGSAREGLGVGESEREWVRKSSGLAVVPTSEACLC